MTPQQLEAVVMAAVDQFRATGSAEDDRIEFKREWPGPNKARQLAGAANRAHGSYIIYVIGIDEKTGTVHPVAGVDPAVWWSQTSARFDQVAPDLLRHLYVYLSAGETVCALLFATDRAPYVIKADGGSPEREVPIRDGTRTRSARRDELLRLLVPAVAVPPAVLLSANVSGAWRAATQPGEGRIGRQETTDIWGQADVFIEHIGPEGVLLPAHEMRGELVSGDLRFLLEPRVHVPSSKESLPPPTFGVSIRNDGVAVTGPGRFAARLSVSPALRGDYRERFRSVEDWKLMLSFGVTGATQQIKLDATLKLDPTARHDKSETMEDLPQWVFGR